MSKVLRENIGFLNDKLIVIISKNDYLDKYNWSLKKLAEKAKVPGFRKGMIPIGVIQKKHGKEVLNEEVKKLLDKTLEQYLSQEKINMIGKPMPLFNPYHQLDDTDLQDFSFEYEIGLTPPINIDYSSIDLIKYNVEINEELINQYIDDYQFKFGDFVYIEEVTNLLNVLTLHFKECDFEGNVIENGIAKDLNCIPKYFSDSFQNKLLGKHINEKFTIQLKKAIASHRLETIATDLGLDASKDAELQKCFSVTITKIGNTEKADINETLFNKLFPNKAIKTEAQFIEEIKKIIEIDLAYESTKQLQDQVYHYIQDDLKVDFPENYLKRYLTQTIKNSYNNNAIDKNMEAYKKRIKWVLASNHIVKENNLTVTPEEIKAAAMNQITSYMNQQIDVSSLENNEWINTYVENVVKDKKFYQETYDTLLVTKILKTVVDNTHPREESISYDEFSKKLHHHHY